MKVLIADDSAPVRRALLGLLEHLPGITVYTAADSWQANACLRVERPDAAIIDLRMPGGGGLAVLEQGKRCAPGTLLIVLTNCHDAFNRAACLEAGADHFLDKHSQFQEAVRLVTELGSRLAAEWGTA